MISGDGSSAIITLNGIRYESAPGDRTIELAIIDITLTATASVPFQYNAENIVFAYADDNNPCAHTQDGHVWGPSPMEDYTPYTPPDPLRIGQLAKTETTRGLVILRMGLKSRYILILTNSDSSTLAEWALTSK